MSSYFRLRISTLMQELAEQIARNTKFLGSKFLINIRKHIKSWIENCYKLANLINKTALYYYYNSVVNRSYFSDPDNGFNIAMKSVLYQAGTAHSRHPEIYIPDDVMYPVDHVDTCSDQSKQIMEYIARLHDIINKQEQLMIIPTMRARKLELETQLLQDIMKLQATLTSRRKITMQRKLEKEIRKCNLEKEIRKCKLEKEIQECKLKNEIKKRKLKKDILMLRKIKECKIEDGVY